MRFKKGWNKLAKVQEHVPSTFLHYLPLKHQTFLQWNTFTTPSLFSFKKVHKPCLSSKVFILSFHKQTYFSSKDNIASNSDLKVEIGIEFVFKYSLAGQKTFIQFCLKKKSLPYLNFWDLLFMYAPNNVTEGITDNIIVGDDIAHKDLLLISEGPAKDQSRTHYGNKGTI